MPPFKWLSEVAALCRDVYQDGYAAKSLGVMGIHDVRFRDDFCCLYVTPGTVYVAVRGTDSWEDWKSNFQIIGRYSWCGIPVHKGFAIAALGLRNRVLEILELYPGHRIVFCGHSRGGAIALLLAIAAEQHFPTAVVQCVTFGQPRVSTETQIRERFYGEYIRVQNGSDAVCRWPKIGFSHAGTCLYLTNRGEERWVIDPSATRRFVDQFLTGLQRKSDHSIHQYTEDLMRCAP